ncbi:hypothetical protein [Niveibacterium terrae]|uniref:hypothetical protein n=1 Tax=Niveibacterium terrae TaxID=3373598 RepID=UPI003A8D366D
MNATQSAIDTNFLGNINDFLAEGLSSVQPMADRNEAEDTVLPNGLALAKMPSRGRIDMWWIAAPDSPFATLEPEEIIGSVLHNSRGKTSPIAGFDPSCRRIVTRSGSVYELGMPETGFAAHGRRVLRRLGF